MYYTESPVFSTLQGSKSIHPSIQGSMAHLHVQKKSLAHLNADPIKVVVWNTDYMGISEARTLGRVGLYRGLCIYIYKYTTPLIWGDSFINHTTRIQWNEAFFVAHLMGKKVDEFKKMSASCHGLWRPVFGLPASKIYCKWKQNMKCLGGSTPFPKKQHSSLNFWNINQPLDPDKW